jgi:hypothetical protein
LADPYAADLDDAAPPPDLGGFSRFILGDTNRGLDFRAPDTFERRGRGGVTDLADERRQEQE